MGKYDDIIHLSRPEPSRPRMRRGERAKLFAPFSALNGHSEAVHSKEKRLLPQPILTDDVQSILDQKLQHIKAGDTITVMYFGVQERMWSGLFGEYMVATDTVVRIDTHERMLYLRNTRVPIDDVLEIRGKRFDKLEDYDAFSQYCG